MHSVVTPSTISGLLKENRQGGKITPLPHPE